MKIKYSSIPVADKTKALEFYTKVLGFVKKQDLPMGGPDGPRWLTVVSPQDPEGVELLLEPNSSYPAMKALKESLVKDGIPYTAFEVEEIGKEYKRLLALGVKFTQPPIKMGNATMAVFHDTCG